MRRSVLSMLMILVVTTTMVSPGLGATPSVVTVNQLNLRSGPGTGFRVVEIIPRDATLVMLARHGDWTHVQTAAGLNGWVYGQYIEVDAFFKETTATVQVDVARLNLRQGPATAYPVVSTLLESQLLQVTGEIMPWYQVQVSGKTGYVHRDLVTLVDDNNSPPNPIGLPLARTTVNLLNMRSGGGLHFPVITRLNQGTVVAVLDNGAWSRVMLENGVIGFVSSDYIVPAEGQALATINARSVNQRTGPGTEFSVMATHTLGSTLTCLGWEDSWVKVSSPAGEGYIFGSLLSFGFGSSGANPGAYNLAGFRVLLDAGHGGRDPGAIGVNGLHEKAVNLILTHKLAALLRQSGAEVVMTRETDVFLTLDERVDIVNSSGAHLAVSIHNNAHPNRDVSGTQVFYGVTGGSFDLGHHVRRQLVGIGLQDRGLLTANFKLLRLTQIPAILTETAFLSNRGDAALLSSNAFLDRAAQAHYVGISEWLLRQR